ncbi:MAG: PEGA domain-containing protein [Calditrichia bacterium]
MWYELKEHSFPKIISVLIAISMAVAMFFNSGCTTKDGVIAFANPTFGGLDIVTNVDSARIFIDGRDSGMKTPALLNDIPSGVREIELLLPGFELLKNSAEVVEGEVARINVDLTALSGDGNLIVETNPAGSLVLLDKLPVGRTPLSLNGLPAGSHDLIVFKGGRESIRETIQIANGQTLTISRDIQPFRHVLVEHLSNTNCIPCPGADDIIEALLEEVGVDSATSIAYHPNYPGETDPFFLAAADDIIPRIEYYSVPPIPFVMLDGIKPSTLFNLEENMRNGFAERFAEMPIATLDILGYNESFADFAELKGRIRATALDALGSDITLQIALIEREISFPPTDPPGTNGDTNFTDVLRAFYPTAEGTPVSLAAGESVDVAFDFTAGAGWSEDLHVVAFLQRNTDREVLQSVWSIIIE